MNRNLKLALLFFVAVPAGCFVLMMAIAFLNGFIGLDFDAEKISRDARFYFSGMVAGWWICGGKP